MANKKLNTRDGRQYRLVAEQPFTFDQVADTGVAVEAVKLPAGAIVVGGFVVVEVAFDTATSAVLDVGDAAVANRYANDVNLKAVGITQLTLSGQVTDGSNVLITPVLVGAGATVGQGRLVLEYIIPGRAQEVQPN